MSLNDTIVAISTPLGEGGIGIVRLSGKDAIELADRVFLSPSKKKLRELKSHTLTYGFIVDPESAVKIDEALFSVMRAPFTYTRQDIVEINCHGGMLPLSNTLSLIIRLGARLAEPGEFTKRAFLNGRIDLLQAEAIIDVIRAKTDRAEKIALQQLEGKLSFEINDIIDKMTALLAKIEACIDFPDEDIDFIHNSEMIEEIVNCKLKIQRLVNTFEEGRFFREGVNAVIIGKPNVGKSSLLNCLLQKDRAIVTEQPGTTRDIIEDYLNIKGLPLKISDTAGIRDSKDIIEKEGVKRSLQAIENADIILSVFDCSKPIDDNDIEILNKIKNKKGLIIINKIDIESHLFNISDLGIKEDNCIKISVLRQQGLEKLKEKIYSICISGLDIDAMDGCLVSNIRHKNSLERALEFLNEAEDLINKAEPLEIIASVLSHVLNCLGEITGSVTSEDILNKIFKDFCIGK